MATPQNAVATRATAPVATNNLGTLQGLLERYKHQIAVALPRHMTPERMIRVALSAYSSTPGLQDCTPVSIAACVVQASILGLEPQSAMHEAYLIPRYNGKTKRKECTLQPGYRGVLKLARNSGEIGMADVQSVYDKDDFDFQKGSTPWLRHKWAKAGDRGAVIGYWAGYTIKTTNEFRFEYWTREQAQEHRDKFASSRDKEGKIYGPWVDHFDSMAKKSVLTAALNLAPKSVELATATALADQADAGLSQKFVDIPLELQPADDGDEQPLAIEQPKRASEAHPEQQSLA